MQLVSELTASDKNHLARLRGFVPSRIFDIHTHPVTAAQFGEGNRPAMIAENAFLDIAAYHAAMNRWLVPAMQNPDAAQIEGLFFGFPTAGTNREEINTWVAHEVCNAGGNNRALALVSPDDDPAQVAEMMREKNFAGIKVYHCWAAREDTQQAAIEEFAPDWMWQICHDIAGVLMLHIVRDRAIADAENQKSLRRLCREYSQCRVVLAHIARSFNYRHAIEGLHSVADLDNVWVDTSAITEAESFRAALEILGPRRVVFGTDYAVSELRGRCVALGDNFFWLHPETVQKTALRKTGDMTLIGIESLLALRDACEDSGLSRGDIADIFHSNALRLLAPHLDLPKENETVGRDLWRDARTKISGGTGLLSKRAEMFDPQNWPSYFSRCEGCQVWDLSGKKFVDFAGGIGAVLLGYNDRDIKRAVQRRLDAGTYCSLVSPDEVELAALLLELHPWAGKVRYARGGGEAMAMAVRIARAATGKSGVAFCGYHGWHDWYLAANLGAGDVLGTHLLPGLEPLGVPRELQGTAVGFRYNDFASFENALQQLDENVAAVVMEPMRSQFPRDDFLRKVASRCRAKGAVLVMDEITSGWRFGFPGACSKFDLTPDIAVYAKAMSNGFPCAAVVGRAEVMDAADASFISSSYWTEGIGFAATLACIQKMRAGDVQNEVWNKGENLQRSLKELATRHKSCRLQIGGMPVAPSLVFDLGESSAAAKTLMIRGMLAQNFLMSSQLYLMYAHDETHISAMLETLDQVLENIVVLIEKGKLQNAAGMQISATGFGRLN